MAISRRAHRNVGSVTAPGIEGQSAGHVARESAENQSDSTEGCVGIDAPFRAVCEVGTPKLLLVVFLNKVSSLGTNHDYSHIGVNPHELRKDRRVSNPEA